LQGRELDGNQPLPREVVGDPRPFRRGIGVIGEVLQGAPAAAAEMDAGREGAAGTRRQDLDPAGGKAFAAPSQPAHANPIARDGERQEHRAGGRRGDAVPAGADPGHDQLDLTG
jgi:hypothetical protein